MPNIPNELFITEPAATIMSTPAERKFPTIGTELPTRYFVALKNMPSKSDAPVLCTVINIENMARVMPITHFRILFISFDVPEMTNRGIALI